MSIAKAEYITIASLLSITVLATILLTLPTVSAETEAVDTVTITVPSACSMSSTITTGNEHTATVDSGTYVDDIGETTLKTICNDSNGFSIYAIGYTNDEYGNTKLKSSVGATSDVATGIATSGNTSNWAMKLEAGSGTYAPTIETDTNGSFANYHVIPDSYAKVATFNSTTDATNGSTLDATYAVYMNPTQPAGTYEGKVKYTLVHPASEEPLQPQPSTAGYITYYANASNAVGTMANQSAGNNATVTLYPSNFSRSGYGFAGWSDKYDYATNQNAHFYGPNEDFTTPSDLTTKGLSLYAVWVKSEGSLQDSNKVAALCGTNGVGGSLTTAPTDGTANLTSVTALTDERDNQTYAIARLADGNCWMIGNLGLENTATTGATNTALAQGYNSSFTGLANPESADFTNSTTANSLYSTDGSTENTISGSYYQGYRFPRYNSFNTQQRAENTSNTDVNTYSYGNYYTWAAAIADTTDYSTNNQSITNTSICPTGWRLPKGGNKSNEANNEFWSLVVDGINGGIKPANYDSSAQPFYTGTPEGKDASTKLRSYPNNFLYSGGFYTSSATSRGGSSFYWSSTVSDDRNSYFLSLSSSGVYPGTRYNFKSNGRSIRCLAIGS